MQESIHKRRNLVIFDFDGTLTRSDTMVRLAIFRFGYLRFFLRLLRIFPYLVLYAAGLYPNQRAKERFLAVFFGNMKEQEFNSLCNFFASKVLPSLIMPDALLCLKKHLSEGDRVLVITASAENWVKPWCEATGVECVASRLEVRQGRITGRLSGKNCYGEEKIVRMKEVATPEKYACLIVYGDSRGDIPLGKVADKFYYKKFTG